VKKDKLEELIPEIKSLKKKYNILLIFAAVSLVISVLAICISLPVLSIDSMGFLGWTMAVLSMLVVILMGWHIFNILDLKELRESVSKIEVLKNSVDKLDDFAVQINNKYNKIDNTIINIVDKLEKERQSEKEEEKTKFFFSEFKKMYDKLLEIKEEHDFKKYGFSIGGPYNGWLYRINELKNNPESNLLLKKGVLFGELEALGYAYVDSKGAETEKTRWFNDIFRKAIN
jgi:hypothetical protein